MKARDLIELFVNNPEDRNGGSNNTGVASISIVESDEHFALYSYQTCIARRWEWKAASGETVVFMWVNSLKYTATTTRYQGMLRLAMHYFTSGGKSLTSYEYHEDPKTKENALVTHDAVLEQVWKAQRGYAEGFGPVRGKNAVHTQFGQLVRGGGR